MSYTLWYTNAHTSSDVEARYTDDRSAVSGHTIDSINACEHVQQLLQSVPSTATACGESTTVSNFNTLKLPHYLHVSGWHDASASAALLAHECLKSYSASSSIIVGPWTHGGTQHVRAHDKTTRSSFDFQRVSTSVVLHLYTVYCL
jgi:predicted acyl esterase